LKLKNQAITNERNAKCTAKTLTKEQKLACDDFKSKSQETAENWKQLKSDRLKICYRQKPNCCRKIIKDNERFTKFRAQLDNNNWSTSDLHTNPAKNVIKMIDIVLKSNKSVLKKHACTSCHTCNEVPTKFVFEQGKKLDKMVCNTTTKKEGCRIARKKFLEAQSSWKRCFKAQCYKIKTTCGIAMELLSAFEKKFQIAKLRRLVAVVSKPKTGYKTLKSKYSIDREILALEKQKCDNHALRLTCIRAGVINKNYRKLASFPETKKERALQNEITLIARRLEGESPELERRDLQDQLHAKKSSLIALKGRLTMIQQIESKAARRLLNERKAELVDETREHADYIRALSIAKSIGETATVSRLTKKSKNLKKQISIRRAQIVDAERVLSTLTTNTSARELNLEQSRAANERTLAIAQKFSSSEECIGKNQEVVKRALLQVRQANVHMRRLQRISSGSGVVQSRKLSLSVRRLAVKQKAFTNAERVLKTCLVDSFPNAMKENLHEDL